MPTAEKIHTSITEGYDLQKHLQKACNLMTSGKFVLSPKIE